MFPVLLNLGEPGGFAITRWADRGQTINARYYRTVIKWGNTRYAVSDTTHNAGEWTLHLVTDSSFTRVLAIHRR